MENSHETAKRLARGESRDYQEGLAHGHIAAMSQFADVAAKLAQPPAIKINVDPAELARLRAIEAAAREVLPLFDNDGPLVEVYKAEGDALRAALDSQLRQEG